MNREIVIETACRQYRAVDLIGKIVFFKGSRVKNLKTGVIGTIPYDQVRSEHAHIAVVIDSEFIEHPEMGDTRAMWSEDIDVCIT